MSKLYIGIDPGASGGIASIYELGGGSVGIAVVMPKTEKDLWNLMSNGLDQEDCESCFAVIEQVGGFIGGPSPGSAMFKFGMSYGGLRMALTAAGIPFEAVPPQKWQKALGIPPKKKATGTEKVQLTKGKHKGEWRVKKTGGESGTEFKNRLKAHAQQLFPNIEVTLSTADALLIAEYCKRKRQGTL